MANPEYQFTIVGQPVGKPRMTQRDQWMHRECVVRYRLWADRARLAAPELPEMPARVRAIAFLSLPDSLSKRKRAEMVGKPHRVRPDSDNILKAICDALFANDAVIYDEHILKFWDDGKGARVEVSVW